MDKFYFCFPNFRLICLNKLQGILIKQINKDPWKFHWIAILRKIIIFFQKKSQFLLLPPHATKQKTSKGVPLVSPLLFLCFSHPTQPSQPTQTQTQSIVIAMCHITGFLTLCISRAPKCNTTANKKLVFYATF